MNLIFFFFQVAVLFERVKETLAERMLVMPWLDEETRTQAVFRLRSLRGKFQIWPGFFNETLLAQEMVDVSNFSVKIMFKILGMFKDF